MAEAQAPKSLLTSDSALLVASGDGELDSREKAPSQAKGEPDVVEDTPPVLPPNLAIGKFEEVPHPFDRSLRVAHANGKNDRAIVYLHGMCGDSNGADRFADLLTRYGTVVVVRATIPCEDRPGYRWPAEPQDIEPRILSALSHVAQLRNGLLNTKEVVLFGYSQGAHRGEKLADAYPERYRDLILGGPPTAPTPEKLHSVRRVAILGGELEDTEHMRLGDDDLRAAGKSSRFFLLPSAHHGSYGPQGALVIREALAWTLGPPPTP